MMKDQGRTSGKDDILEENVSTLLEVGGEAPRIATTSRARIRATLIERHGKEVKRRSPVLAGAIGLTAAAAAAVVVTRLIVPTGPDAPAIDPDQHELADGSTWLVPTEGGGKVIPLGQRHVRVEGVALLDVAPGKGKFVVETDRGTIEVLGTRFYVSADASRTKTAVVRGSVKLVSSEGEVTLHAGEQGIAEAGHAPTRAPAERLSHLVSWAAEARRKQDRTVAPLRNGTLFAHDPNNPWVPESPLPIAKLTVDVAVEDQVARVALDQTFHNPSDRVLEGMYRFAIPSDAALQRLAMYVNGNLMESAVVERMQGRRIYEDIVNRRLDPALLEWAGVGRLSLRVYPLPPRDDKRLVLAYTQSLPRLYDDWSLSVPLPEVDLPVGELAFDVRVKNCASCEISSTSHAITVAKAGADATVTVRAKGARLGDSLVLRVRDPRRQPLVSVAKDGKDDFVMVRARPELAAAARAYKPRTWVILDDVSASRSPMELRAQADLVDGFVRELDEEDRVSVVAFDVAARTLLAPTRVLDVDRKALRTSLDGEGGVGATDFTVALDAAMKLTGGDKDATIVYLGDGVITSGPRNLDAVRAKIAGAAHFVGVGVGDGPDTQTLEALAAATAGYSTTIDLADDVGWRAFDLVAALNTPRVTGLQAKLVDATGAEVQGTAYVKTPQLADGEELELVAKVQSLAPEEPAGGGARRDKGAPAAVELTGAIDGQPWHQRIPVDVAKATQGGYLPRLWAQRHVAARLLAKHEPVALPPCTEAPVTPAERRAEAEGKARPPAVCPSEADVREERDEKIRKEVVELGKRYFLLSRHTSLLVLEDDAMYARYGVTKGAGATWAPYVLPAKLPPPMPGTVAIPDDIADGAELLRTPLELYDPSVYALQQPVEGFDWHMRTAALERARTAGIVAGPITGAMATRGRLGLAKGKTRGAVDLVPEKSEKWASDKSGGDAVEAKLDEGKLGKRAAASDFKAQDDDNEADLPMRTEQAKREVVTTDELQNGVVGGGGTGYFNYKHSDRRGRWRAAYPTRLQYPGDAAYDDLTAFVPALSADASDAWRAQLTAAAGIATTHAIDDDARAQLVAARRALPTGVYRWEDYEIAVDDARRIGWRRTTPFELAETASFDGTTWTRRYAELGLDVTRRLTEDDVAFALAYVPVWIADPVHYARWFEVRADGPHRVALKRAAGGKSETVFVLVFDDHDHLVAIRDGRDNALVSVTWGAAGPTAARVLDEDVTAGFTAQPVADAVSWAHGGGAAGVVVELPVHVPGYWDARIAKLATGSAEWRHAQRQSMPANMALGQIDKVVAAYEALRTNGGVEPGDLALAAGALAGATDAVQAKAFAPFAGSPIVKYVTAGRAYMRTAKLDSMKPAVTDGLVGALWATREATALAVAGNKLAIDRALALPAHAIELRTLLAGVFTGRYDLPGEDVARVWDSVAVGQQRNTARMAAVQAVLRTGNQDAAAARVEKLVAELDLAATPANVGSLQWTVQQSRRGAAGWQLIWNTWRDRVLAGASYDHVMALLQSASEHPADVPAMLDRAGALAGNDPDRILAVARLAASQGQALRAQTLVAPLLKGKPTREILQFVAHLELGRGQIADGLAHLEAAQDAGADEAVDVNTVRTEMREIIGLAQQLALQDTGAPRTEHVNRALAWGKRWRAVDAGNPEIDQLLGNVLLAAGDAAGAWRQLSTVIERDPMSGTGYMTVAEAFERQGRVKDALDYWQQAIVIDQTNPTPRLRKAQALFALGRTAEGDALLAEIAGRRWHVRWDGVVWQVQRLIDAKH